MINIPVKAEVLCSDGIVGRLTYIIVNPINRRMTHLVVKDNQPPFGEHLVSVDQVVETTPELVKLSCTRDDLRKMKWFIYQEYIKVELPDYKHLQDTYLVWPYILPAPGIVVEEEDKYIPVELENLPPGELAVRRGAHVEATDGYIGQVDELLINSNNMRVVYLVLRERHLWRGRDVTIPVSQIDHIEEDSVYVKLDRRSVEALPTVPVQRWLS
jgi:sporulation protein YlmC with PRC-barrel domain